MHQILIQKVLYQQLLVKVDFMKDQFPKDQARISPPPIGRGGDVFT